MSIRSSISIFLFEWLITAALCKLILDFNVSILMIVFYGALMLGIDILINWIYGRYLENSIIIKHSTLLSYLFKNFQKEVGISLSTGVFYIDSSFYMVFIFPVLFILVIFFGKFLWFFISKDRILGKEQRYRKTVNDWERLPENDKDVLLGMFKGSEKVFKHVSGLLPTPDKSTPTEILTLIEMWNKIPRFAKQKFINELSSKGAGKAVNFLEGIGKM